MIKPSVKATYEGKPLSVLSELIQIRQKWLHEGYKDAVAATAINALRSIRTVTTSHYGKNVVHVGNSNISISRRNDIHPSFRGAARKRCFRAGSSASRNARVVDLGSHCVQLVPPDDKAWLHSSVWTVKLSKEQSERWFHQPAQFYVAATSEDVVVAYLQKRCGRIANRHAGMARAVLGAAMAMLSTLPPAISNVGSRVSRLMRKYVLASTMDHGDTYSVRVGSELSYAVDAVKGGMAGVSDALKRAANKVAGLLRHKAASKLSNELSTPFPEVRR